MTALMPRATVDATKDAGGLTYTVTVDGAAHTVPAAVIEALYCEAPSMPDPLIDRPNGANLPDAATPPDPPEGDTS